MREPLWRHITQTYPVVASLDYDGSTGQALTIPREKELVHAFLERVCGGPPSTVYSGSARILYQTRRDQQRNSMHEAADHTEVLRGAFPKTFDETALPKSWGGRVDYTQRIPGLPLIGLDPTADKVSIILRQIQHARHPNFVFYFFDDIYARKIAEDKRFVNMINQQGVTVVLCEYMNSFVTHAPRERIAQAYRLDSTQVFFIPQNVMQL